MKSGELAAALGLSRDAVNTWLKRPEFEQFFSPDALGRTGASQRYFNESDVLILNTVRWLRYEQNVTEWPAIAARLEQGERHSEFPQNAVSADQRTIPIQQAEQSARAMATMAERDNALIRVKELESEIGRLKADVKAEQEGRRADVERFMREMGQLQRELGAALALLEAYQGKQNND